MLNYATDKGERPDGPNPCRKVKRYKEHSRERFLSEAELGALGAAIAEAETIGVPWYPNPHKKVKHAPKEENRHIKIDSYAAAALRLLLFTGARLREVLNLKWQNVDFERGVLTQSFSYPSCCRAEIRARERGGLRTLSIQAAFSSQAASPHGCSHFRKHIMPMAMLAAA
jgi:integrase